MSVTSVSLQSEEYEQDGSTYAGTRVYRVAFDDPANDDASDALSADDGTVAVPDKGDAFKVGSSAKVRRKRAAKVSDGHVFDVTVEYSSSSPDLFGGGEEEEESPLDRDWEYSYEDQVITEPYFFDQTTPDALPMANSAGEPFDTLPEREVTVGGITITRNMASFSDATAQSYRGLVNSDSVTINGTTYSAGQLRLRTWSASGPFVENGVTYYSETLNVAKRVEGWDQVYEDRGYSYLDGGELKPIKITDDDGEEVQVSKPWPLDGAGAKKAAPTDTPAQLLRKPYEVGSLSGVLGD